MQTPHSSCLHQPLDRPNRSLGTLGGTILCNLRRPLVGIARDRRTVDKGIKNVFAVFGNKVIDVAKDSTRSTSNVSRVLGSEPLHVATNHMMAIISG